VDRRVQRIFREGFFERFIPIRSEDGRKLLEFGDIGRGNDDPDRVHDPDVVELVEHFDASAEQAQLQVKEHEVGALAHDHRYRTVKAAVRDRAEARLAHCRAH
jgi:hypothetical protein